MNYSEQIEKFLNFLREARQEYDIAAAEETEANNATQDLLHSLELDDNKYHDSARIALALKQIRKERREAKDKEVKLQPIIDWSAENIRVIQELEQLLGAVRKAERNSVGRRYIPKTDVLKKTLKEIKKEER